MSWLGANRTQVHHSLRSAHGFPINMKHLYVNLLGVPAVLYSISLFSAQSSDGLINTEANTSTPTISEASTLKIRLTVNGRSVTATLIDSPTSRDFISMLPLTLTLEDYASTEKIAYLSRRLSEEGAPAGIDPSIGDITYYAPWGNLALFYKDFGYAKGLIKLGSIKEGAEVFNIPGSVTVTIVPRNER